MTQSSSIELSLLVIRFTVQLITMVNKVMKVFAEKELNCVVNWELMRSRGESDHVRLNSEAGIVK